MPPASVVQTTKSLRLLKPTTCFGILAGVTRDSLFFRLSWQRTRFAYHRSHRSPGQTFIACGHVPRAEKEHLTKTWNSFCWTLRRRQTRLLFPVPLLILDQSRTYVPETRCCRHNKEQRSRFVMKQSSDKLSLRPWTYCLSLSYDNTPCNHSPPLALGLVHV